MIEEVKKPLFLVGTFSAINVMAIGMQAPKPIPPKIRRTAKAWKLLTK
jgi:hypothetical protein